MKTIPIALANHLAGDVTSVCHCWKITRRDGMAFGFTDYHENLTFGGLTYVPSTGIETSSITVDNSLAVANLDVAAALDGGRFVERDFANGVWDGAAVLLYLVNWADPTAGQVVLRSGTIGRVSQKGSTLSVEVRGLAQALQQPMGRVYQASCDAVLGDSRCRATVPKHTGAVTTIVDAHTITDTTLTAADGFHDNGKLTWTTGSNTGMSVEVKTQVGGTIVLQLAPGFEMQVGDEFEVSAGCDHTSVMCQSKFSNILNFRGFPHIPGRDRILSGT